jgi:predicted MFS family arabinose efflux permease
MLAVWFIYVSREVTDKDPSRMTAGVATGMTAGVATGMTAGVAAGGQQGWQ